MIKGYIIAIEDQQLESVGELINSIENTDSQIQPIVFNATVPETIDEDLDSFTYFNKKDWKWNWPLSPEQNHSDFATGIYKFCYGAADQRKKIACSISHMRLWDLCVVTNEPIIIFEADALMTRRFDTEFDANVVGLNDPRGTTRRSDVFHERVSMREGVQIPPTVNNVGEMMPQGLAGHSAYYIRPEGAKVLLDNVKKYGMWPNDAYMCKELFPWIRVVYPYYTKVQGTVSTTTR
jgi:GR25 family glycosyltransferase involved in LPS biosynthesis